MPGILEAQQLVIIAKPGPDQPYRQLATAFQTCSCSQCYLHPCLDALCAFSDESHRVGILQELAFAAEHPVVDADFMLPAEEYYETSEQRDADYRFPYITATLVSSIAGCVEQKHLHHNNSNYRCSLEASFHTNKNVFRAAHEPLYMDCTSELRHVTVTVIDITDLHKLRYCFLDMRISCVKCGLRSYHPEIKTLADLYGDKLPDTEMSEYTPSSGWPVSYRTGPPPKGVRGPYREGMDVKAFEMLQAYPVIDLATLENCWPAAAWKVAVHPPAGSNQPSVDLDVTKRGSKSLGELAEHKLLDAILLGLLDDLELLEYPMLTRGFPKSFLATCASRADELAASEHQEIIAAMLARLLEGVDHVDFYPFRRLQVDTIRAIIRSDRLRGMKSLNLSGLFDGSPEEIWKTLDAIPHQPEMIYILSPPSMDRTAEKAGIKTTIPHYTRGRQPNFWDRVGSKNIVMSSSVSTALMSFASSQRKSNLQWEHTHLNYLRELVRGDTMRLRLWPWMWW